MKKLLRSFIVSLLVLGSVSTAFAYASQSSCTLKKGSGGSQTAYVGYSRKANLSGKSDSSSKQIVELACWASWKGAIYPTTKEGRVNLSAGESRSFTETQSKDSIFRASLCPLNGSSSSGSASIKKQ